MTAEEVWELVLSSHKQWQGVWVEADAADFPLLSLVCREENTEGDTCNSDNASTLIPAIRRDERISRIIKKPLQTAESIFWHCSMTNLVLSPFRRNNKRRWIGSIKRALRVPFCSWRPLQTTPINTSTTLFHDRIPYFLVNEIKTSNLVNHNSPRTTVQIYKRCVY